MPFNICTSKKVVTHPCQDIHNATQLQGIKGKFLLPIRSSNVLNGLLEEFASAEITIYQ